MRTITASLVLASALLLAGPSAAIGASRFADVRVVTNDGQTLTDVRQYTDDVRVKASSEADCFGDGNPSSNQRYRLRRPNTLGALVDAASFDRALRPLMVTDAFFDDGYGFGVCDIGGIETEGFSYWYLAVNGEGATTGPDLIPVHNRDRHLWYLTSGSEAGFPAELELRAPARAVVGEPFTVRVLRHFADGTREPAVGVTVTGALAAPTDAEGRTQATVTGAKNDLRATGGTDDAPSAELRVCGSDTLADCPPRRGLRIYGSSGPDRIRATRGPDKINCGRGRDIVYIRRGERDDRIARSCERVIRR